MSTARFPPVFRMNLSTPVLVMIGLFLPMTSYSAEKAWTKPSSSPAGASEYRSKVGQSRWTLKDWLEQKERNKMMDLWLGMYAPSPYEFVFSVGQQDYTQTIDNPATTTNYKSLHGDFAFFAMILGIQAVYENNWNERFVDTQGLINLRLAGNSNQSTHLNVFFGIRNRTSEAGLNLKSQTVVGAELDLYIEKHIGLHGLFKYYSPKDEASLGSVSGQRSEGGIFIEFKQLRIFGNWLSESFTGDATATGGALIHNTRIGWHSGIRLFF